MMQGSGDLIYEAGGGRPILDRAPPFFHILIFYRDYCTIALKSTNPPNENDSDPPASNRVKSNIHELQNHDHEDAVVI